MRFYSHEEKKIMSEQLKKSISILQVAEDLGYHPIKKSQRYYTLKEHDSVVMDTKKNCFYRNSDNSKGARGSIIDFVVYFNSCSLETAYDLLYAKAGGQESFEKYLTYQPKTDIAQYHIEEKKEFLLPKRGDTRRNVYAYLTKTRMIDPEIVDDFFNRKMLYQDDRKNCVFVAYDSSDTAVFACIRGTNTYVRFVGDVSGSDYSKGFYINNHADKLFVTESVIDAMSYMDYLKHRGENYKEWNYFVLTGTEKTMSLLYNLKKYPENRKIVSGLDNDKAGEKASMVIEQIAIDNEVDYIRKSPKYKDWNEDIKKGAWL